MKALADSGGDIITISTRSRFYGLYRLMISRYKLTKMNNPVWIFIGLHSSDKDKRISDKIELINCGLIKEHSKDNYVLTEKSINNIKEEKL